MHHHGDLLDPGGETLVREEKQQRKVGKVQATRADQAGRGTEVGDG